MATLENEPTPTLVRELCCFAQRLDAWCETTHALEVDLARRGEDLSDAPLSYARPEEALKDDAIARLAAESNCFVHAALQHERREAEKTRVRVDAALSMAADSAAADSAGSAGSAASSWTAAGSAATDSVAKHVQKNQAEKSEKSLGAWLRAETDALAHTERSVRAAVSWALRRGARIVTTHDVDALRLVVRQALEARDVTALLAAKAHPSFDAVVGEDRCTHEMWSVMITDFIDAASDARNACDARDACDVLGIVRASGCINMPLVLERIRRDVAPAVASALCAVVSFNPNCVDGRGEPPLIRAVVLNHINLVVALVALPPDRIDVNFRDALGCTALAYACCFSREEAFRALWMLPAGRLDANTSNNRGETVLMLAAKKDALTVVQALLADPARFRLAHAKDALGRTALMHACANGCYRVVCFMLAFFPRVNFEEATHALSLTVRGFGRLDVASLFLALPPGHVDVNAADDDGNTLLMSAIMLLRFDFAVALLNLPAERVDTRVKNRAGLDARALVLDAIQLCKAHVFTDFFAKAQTVARILASRASDSECK